MDEVTFEFTGGKELERALADLGRKTERKFALKALRVGGKVIAKEAKRLVPTRTGTLKKSIGVATIPKKHQGAAVSVLARKGKNRKYDGWYAHLVEFGTVNTTAQPFFRPAFQQKAQEAIETTGKLLGKLVEEEVKNRV